MNIFTYPSHRGTAWLKRLAASLALGLAAHGGAQAAIHVQATRVVYNGKAASASVAISNKSTMPYMVQTWLDTGDSTAMPENLPMAITPPLMRLGPGEEALVRTIYAGQGLPADRESLFWINIQEIPPSSDAANALQVAIRTRIKLFYRPPQLKTTLDEAARALQWRISGQALQVTNPGPLHITFAHIQGRDAGGGAKNIDADMIAPGQTLTVPLRQLNLAGGASSLRFGYINDYGGVSEVADAPLRR
ncbi:fimbrial biogenesis chaperone [Bordetella petrii]|uniref:fimbrial biogenesis chaperone n=1 Tax=Bordetella petrii TaxID=94624 RepID=UPI001A9584A4|nr:molecular chaperone [Bordetella petrii]MBO1114633.1 molecular chaperone [Bordetella petrii]